MKKILGVLMCLTIVLLSGCSSNSNSLMYIDKSFALLGEPLSTIIYYENDTKGVIVENDEELGILHINFDADSKETGFLGFDKEMPETISVFYEEDTNEKIITTVAFLYDEVCDIEKMNKVLYKWLENNEEDFYREESKLWDYSYVYNYNSDKKILFGKSTAPYYSAYDYCVVFKTLE